MTIRRNYTALALQWGPEVGRSTVTGRCTGRSLRKSARFCPDGFPFRCEKWRVRAIGSRAGTLLRIGSIDPSAAPSLLPHLLFPIFQTRFVFSELLIRGGLWRRESSRLWFTLGKLYPSGARGNGSGSKHRYELRSYGEVAYAKPVGFC